MNFIQEVKSDANKRKEEYHNWFLIHSGIKQPSNPKKEFKNVKTEEIINENYNNELAMTKTDINDYASWYQRQCIKREREEGNFELYISICKKYYPLAINPINKRKENACCGYFKHLTFIVLHVKGIFA